MMGGMGVPLLEADVMGGAECPLSVGSYTLQNNLFIHTVHDGLFFMLSVMNALRVAG